MMLTLRAFVLAAGALALWPASAQTGVELSYLQGMLPKADGAVTAYGDDLMGDRVNPYNGALSFEHVDVSLPGNGELAVEFRRRHTAGRVPLFGGQLGDWDAVLPAISGYYEATAGWLTKTSQTNRCSGFSIPPNYRRTAVGGGGPKRFGPPVAYDPTVSPFGKVSPSELPPTQTVTFYASDYWQGVNLTIPGQGPQAVLERNPADTYVPTDGNTWPLVTKGGWQLRCLASLKQGAGEGFIAVSPQGVQYRFDWLAARAIPAVKKQGAGLLRNEFMLLATEVTDRFGNWVHYTYSSGSINVTKIEASDGRKLTIGYGSHGVSSVFDGTRTWTYVYGSSNELASVTLPDQSQWRFNLRPLVEGNPYSLGESANCSFPGFYPSNTYTGTISHPSGATGTFTLGWVYHGRSYVHKWCIYEPESTSQTIGAVWPVRTANQALIAKKLAGPGLPSAGLSWSFAYASGPGSWEDCTSNCGPTKTVTVTAPDGAVTRSTFGTRFNVDEGLLLKTEEGLSGTTALRTTSYR